MSVADEIQKLHQLRQQGALTDAEFEQRKNALLTAGPAQPAKKKRRWMLRIILGLGGLALLISGLASLGGNGKMPTCDSSFTQDLLKDAVVSSPLGKTNGLSIVTLSDIGEMSWDETAQVRQCKAMARLNSAETVPVVYQLSWNGKTGGEVLLEFRFP